MEKKTFAIVSGFHPPNIGYCGKRVLFAEKM
jgi:hypothetical protein